MRGWGISYYTIWPIYNGSATELWGEEWQAIGVWDAPVLIQKKQLTSCTQETESVNMVVPSRSGFQALSHDVKRRLATDDCHCNVGIFRNRRRTIWLTIQRNQSNAVADITVTIGYLSALISVLSQALLPRAKFMKIMLFDLLSTCVSASLCCLAAFCAVKARHHSTPADASESVRNGFNSDACVVSAIWLIFMIWFVDLL